MAEDPRAEARRNQQAQLEASLEEMGTVLVRAGRDDGRVALWDTGPEYEGGEVMIKGYAGDPDRDFTYELPKTAMVMRKIADGSLIESDDAGEGAGPAPEPAQLSLTPGGEPQPGTKTAGEQASDRVAERRARAAQAEETRGSATPSDDDAPKSAAPSAASTPSTSDAKPKK